MTYVSKTLAHDPALRHVAGERQGLFLASDIDIRVAGEFALPLAFLITAEIFLYSPRYFFII